MTGEAPGPREPGRIVPEAAVDAALVADAEWMCRARQIVFVSPSRAQVRVMLEAAAPLIAAAERERAEYWHKRWTAALERADEFGGQAIIQHGRILELERRTERDEARLAEVRELCKRSADRIRADYPDAEPPAIPVSMGSILAIIGTEEESRG